MNAKCVVKQFCQLKSERTNHLADAFDRNGTNLLGLSLGVDIEAGLVGWQ